MSTSPAWISTGRLLRSPRRPADDGKFDLELPDGDYVVVARKRAKGEETGPVVAGDNRSEFIKVSVTGRCR